MAERKDKLATAPGRARTAAALAITAAIALSGCAAEPILPKTYSDLPESPDVEKAAWPRLVDNPASLEPTDAKKQIARGKAATAALDARVSKLETSAALLLKRDSESASKRRDAAIAARSARAKRRAAALMRDTRGSSPVEKTAAPAGAAPTKKVAPTPTPEVADDDLMARIREARRRAEALSADE
ncbi:MAG: hypothetical protein MRY74_05630 [Neomegalonema sp.]|nr:hypothetical protein [Neomegalonema sp.]